MMSSTATNFNTKTTFQKLTASVRRLQTPFQQTTHFWQRYRTVQPFQGKPSSDHATLPAAMYTVAQSMMVTSICSLQYLHIAGFIIAVPFPFHPNAVQYHRTAIQVQFMTAVPNKHAYQQLHSLLCSKSDFSQIYNYLRAAHSFLTSQ